MKSVVLLCIFFISRSLCAQQVQVNVVDGYGSGTYNVGDTVFLFSKAVRLDSVFVSWTTQPAVELHNANEWTCWFIVPKGATTVLCFPSWKHSELYQQKETDVFVRGINKKIWYAVPPNPIGVITLHHFTSGTGNLFWSRLDYTIVMQHLYSKGYALISYNAYEVEKNVDGLKQWFVNPLEIDLNEDHLATRAILKELRTRQIITDTTPVYALGMSVGGSYTLSVAHALGFNAWINVCSKGSTQICSITNTPGMFIVSEFDKNKDQDGNDEKARANYQILQDRGVPSEFILHKRYPLYPERFSRIQDITIAKSRLLARELADNGFLDSSYKPIVQSDSLSYAIENFPNKLPTWNALPEELRKECIHQYTASYADHTFTADHTHAIVEFLEQHARKPISSVEYSKQLTDCYTVQNNYLISTINSALPESSTIHIYDIVGNLVFSSVFKEGTYIGNLQHGVYMLVLQTHFPNNILVFRITI